jgi:heme A synthase
MAGDLKVKAFDILVASLNALLSISTVLFAGLLAFSVQKGAGHWQFLLYAALVAFLISAALCVTTINSLIYKANREECDAVRQKAVRCLYFAVLVALFLGLLSGAIFVHQATGPVQGGSTPHVNTIITDDQITVGTNQKGQVVVFKDTQGRISRIEITSH